MRRITIAGRDIGEGCPPFVIAEVGINHNGELAKALEMIGVAKRAGADAVKFQTFRAEEFVGDAAMTFTYRSAGKTVTESMLEMFRRYELKRADWAVLRRRCDQEGILFMSTPQNRSDLDLLLEVGIPAVKVGSDDFTNLPLLASYARTKLPMIVSCGMSNLGEVHQALEAVGSLEGYPTVLLVCTSQYPTPPEEANLLRIRSLREAYPDVPIGYSDHTQGSTASILAVGLGASVFEKHFTLDRSLPGPDHWFSEDPAGLKEWAGAIRTALAMLGSPVVQPTRKELENKKEFQRVIVAGEDIPADQAFTPENLAMRRMPGGAGLAPKLASILLGRKSRRSYRKGEIIEI
jgi:N,N'-diacetyllegionaminate synthase